MAKNLYVGNLAWEVTSDDLYELFHAHGKVALAQVITDWTTGRSRGFGFVEMPNDEESGRARAALDGTPFRGRPLKVYEAKPRDGGPKNP